MNLTVEKASSRLRRIDLLVAEIARGLYSNCVDRNLSTSRLEQFVTMIRDDIVASDNDLTVEDIVEMIVSDTFWNKLHYQYYLRTLKDRR